ELEGVEVQEFWLGEGRPTEVREGQLVVLASHSKPRFTQEAVTGLGLRDVRGGVAHVQSQAALYGLYRFGPNLTTGTAGPTTSLRTRPPQRPASATSGHAATSADAPRRHR